MEAKKWYRSKTIISGILSFILAGYMLAKTFIQTLPDPPPGLVETILGILASIGIFGRVTADTTISK